ncbi:hypothetical protein AB0M43_17960 [Longispora sp. NPDC051575]|uniref:DUF6891 domain-containing protein n=1 Tax=Longispora sp. NPDC051575 TaxID=3154943 RepID=UPI00344957CD
MVTHVHNAKGLGMTRVWPYNDQPVGFALPDYGLTAGQNRELTDRIWSYLTAGSDDAGHFAGAEGGDWPMTPEQLSAAFAHARRARVRQQAQWTVEQVRTNLDLAFDDLTNAGVVARQHFTCCGTCGTAEIGDEADRSRHWRGYVFYHQQDTETLVHEGSVHLSYGIFPPEDFDEDVYALLPEAERTTSYLAELVEFVNTDVVPRLTAHGLRVEWNGDCDTRILVRGAEWYAKL